MHFHNQRYQDRIDELRFAFHAIHQLSRGKRRDTVHDDAHGDGSIPEASSSSSPRPEDLPVIINMPHDEETNKKTGGATSSTDRPPVELPNRPGESRFLKMAHKVGSSLTANIQTIFGITFGFEGLVLQSPMDADRLAKQIFSRIKSDSDATALTLANFTPWFKNERAVKRAFGTFTVYKNTGGAITFSELLARINNIMQEREALQNSLRDLGHSVGEKQRHEVAIGCQLRRW